ncbi:MAG: crossover junction endodeoxyribonuclease RuvC [Candidatus Omnitrophica bacterium]|nr:crossover junction endodeoxyribonuclease RuvC [Candidatus Omnitrophota bacterium]
MIVLGIDVGLRVTGYVICDVKNNNVKLIKEGEIKPSLSTKLPRRLLYIYKELSEIISIYNPQVAVGEKLYSHYRHPTTVALLAQVRGVILFVIENFGLDFYEYSPARVRKSFLGKGNANSLQIKRMAENILGKSLISQHTADAFSLVVAFSHIHRFDKILKNDWKIKG